MLAEILPSIPVQTDNDGSTNETSLKFSRDLHHHLVTANFDSNNAAGGMGTGIPTERKLD